MELYNIKDTINFKFYKLPKELFENPIYNKNLSLTSKVIYAFLLDRLNLSKKYRWFDQAGNIYLIYTKQQIMEILNLSKVTVLKAFKELIKYNLICEVKQKVGKPNIIYVKKINSLI